MEINNLKKNIQKKSWNQEQEETVGIVLYLYFTELHSLFILMSLVD